MSSEFFVDALKIGISALVGGLVTAASALPYFNNKLTKITTEVEIMRSGCTTCKSSVEKSIERINESVNDHHSDDERHNSGTSHALLADILARVMRIETRLFNGHSQSHKDA